MSARSLSRGLVVDDDWGVREFAVAALTEIGYDVASASDIQDAMQVAGGAQWPLDFVITDYDIGGENGLELASKVRRLSPNTRILLMSGSGPDAIAGVVDGFLPKPFTVAQLSAALEGVLQGN